MKPCCTEGETEAQGEAGVGLHTVTRMSVFCHSCPIIPTPPAALLSPGPRCPLEEPWWGRPCPGQAPPSSRSSSVAWNSSASDLTSTEWPRAGSATSRSLRSCSPSLHLQFPDHRLRGTSGAKTCEQHFTVYEGPSHTKPMPVTKVTKFSSP